LDRDLADGYDRSWYNRPGVDVDPRCVAAAAICVASSFRQSRKRTILANPVASGRTTK